MQRKRPAAGLTELSPRRLAVDRLTITLWAGAAMFMVTGVIQWLFDPAPSVWVPSVVALCTAAALAGGGCATLHSRWTASMSAAGDRWAIAIAVLIAVNPLVYIVTTGISYPAIGVMLVVVAIAALVPDGRAAAVVIAIVNVAWLLLVLMYPPEVPTATAVLQIAKADAVAVVIALTWSRTRARLAEATETVRRLALFDQLTGLPNRRQLIEHEHAVLKRTRADGGVFGIVFVDVDDLKSVNDTLGHAAGDARIVAVANAIDAVCDASSMFAARISGDEFVMVVQPATASDLGAVAARVRVAVEATGAQCSVGTALWAQADGATIDGVDSVIARADRMMYADKRIRRANRNE